MTQTIKQKITAGHAITSAQVKDRQKTIPYRPEYNKIAGSPAAALLLNQIAYWFEKSGNKPFYKFRAPCQDDRYREGDHTLEYENLIKDMRVLTSIFEKMSVFGYKERARR